MPPMNTLAGLLSTRRVTEAGPKNAGIAGRLQIIDTLSTAWRLGQAHDDSLETRQRRIQEGHSVRDELVVGWSCFCAYIYDSQPAGLQTVLRIRHIFTICVVTM